MSVQIGFRRRPVPPMRCLLLEWAGTLCLALSLWQPLGASAGERDHEAARQALQAGEVQALPAILEKVAREFPGQVLEVELEREYGIWVYKLRVLQTGGSMVKVKVNARTGAVLGSRTRGRE